MCFNRLKTQWGFTTITYSNIRETERLMQEEIAFVQAQDSQAEKVAVSEVNKLAQEGVMFAPRLVRNVVTTTVSDGQICLRNGSAHECLSTCGIVDFTGPVAAACDFTNSIIYLFEGEYVVGGASFVAVVPLLGIVSKGAKPMVKTSATGLDMAGTMAKKVVKSFTRASIKIADEFGGHTFLKHINIDDNGLLKRIVDDGLPAASRFYSEEIGDKVIRDAVMEKHDEIVKWLGNNTKNEYNIEKSLFYSIGYGYKKVGNDKINDVIKVDSTNNILISLLKDGKGGFYVNSAFPIIIK